MKAEAALPRAPPSAEAKGPFALLLAQHLLQSSWTPVPGTALALLDSQLPPLLLQSLSTGVSWEIPSSASWFWAPSLAMEHMCGTAGQSRSTMCDTDGQAGSTGVASVGRLGAHMALLEKEHTNGTDGQMLTWHQWTEEEHTCGTAKWA